MEKQPVLRGAATPDEFLSSRERYAELFERQTEGGRCEYLPDEAANPQREKRSNTDVDPAWK